MSWVLGEIVGENGAAKDRMWEHLGRESRYIEAFILAEFNLEWELQDVERRKYKWVNMWEHVPVYA